MFSTCILFRKNHNSLKYLLKTKEKRQCIYIPRNYPGFCMLIRNIEKAAAKVLYILQPPFSCQEVAIHIHPYKRRGSLNEAAWALHRGVAITGRYHRGPSSSGR